MEYRLKDGSDLVCEISGQPERALVKLLTDNSMETPWMGIEALKKAYQLLAPIVGAAPLVTHSSPMPVAPAPAPWVNPGVQVTSSVDTALPLPVPSSQPRRFSEVEIRNLNSFQNQLKDLVDNPPSMAEGGNSDGSVPEVHIRRLVGDFQGRFQDQFALYPICKNLLGMPRDRFEKILEMNMKMIG